MSLQERMRANATLMRMMLSREAAMDRSSLMMLAADMDAWAEELDASAIAAARQMIQRKAA